VRGVAASFHRTLAALHADRSRRPVGALTVAVVGLGAWLAWATLARVPLYRSSVHARIEASPAPTRIAAPTTGRIATVHLEMGTRVSAGDVLVELDATAERIAADKAHARAAALVPQLESIERELTADHAAGLHGGTAEIETERQILARLRADDADLAFAEQDLLREQKLAETGASPGALRDKAKTRVEQSRAARDATQHEYESLEASHQERGDTRHAHREQLDRQHGQLVDDLAAANTEIRRVDHDLEQRTMRAPLAGTLGEVTTAQPGALLREGDVIATVVPDGRLRVVADFDAVALGRLAPGQPARLRLDGFAWTCDAWSASHPSSATARSASSSSSSIHRHRCCDMG
jgi:multidrug resistance efflux pump